MITWNNNDKHIYILATLSNQKWFYTILYKTVLQRTWDVLWNNHFFLTSQLHVVFLFCINDRDSYSHGLIFFHGRFFFWIRCYFLYQAYRIFWRSCSYWVPGKWPRALSYIHDSTSLACRNSYCVHHNVSNSLLPATVFWGESCLKLCYPLK